MRMKIFVNLFVIKLFMILLSTSAYSQVGKIVSSVKLKNVHDIETNIPYISKKIVVVFYLDPDVQEINDPLSDALDSEKFPVDKFSAIAVVNCKDTWLPNAGIRAKAKKKQEQFPQSVILLDEELLLAKTWKLAKTNNRLIVMIIGLDSKIKYLKSLGSLEESKSIIPEFLEIIKTEIKI